MLPVAGDRSPLLYRAGGYVLGWMSQSLIMGGVWVEWYLVRVEYFRNVVVHARAQRTRGHTVAWEPVIQLAGFKFVRRHSILNDAKLDQLYFPSGR